MINIQELRDYCETTVKESSVLSVLQLMQSKKHNQYEKAFNVTDSKGLVKDSIKQESIRYGF